MSHFSKLTTEERTKTEKDPFLEQKKTRKDDSKERIHMLRKCHKQINST
jgi:hypothetical protein